MRSRILLFVFCLLLAGVGACSAKPEETPPALSNAAILARIRLNEQTPNVLYTYMDDKNAYVTVEAADKVPDPFRNDVVVVDTRLTPEQRGASSKVVVADLNRRDAEGYFVVRLEDRASFESTQKLKRLWRLSVLEKPPAKPDVAKLRAQGVKTPPPPSTVVLYSTSWCGYCRKVRDFLGSNGVPFTEKDIEKDESAEQDLALRCAAAGVTCNGVPVLDWKGRIISGYNERAMRQALSASPSGLPVKP